MAQPGETYFGAGGTVGEEGPVGVVVFAFAAPLREGVEAGRDGVVATAADVPGDGLGRGAWTGGVHDGEVLEAESDVEGFFVEV